MLDCFLENKPDKFWKIPGKSKMIFGNAQELDKIFWWGTGDSNNKWNEGGHEKESAWLRFVLFLLGSRGSQCGCFLAVSDIQMKVVR